MINRLVRLFIQDCDNVTDPAVREKYGVLSGAVGIVLNLLLSAGKFFAGVVTGSIAITADAFNNLSDAGSSVVTLVGFKLAGQKADDGHPFGHGRAEYLAGLLVSLMILLVGLELGKTSIGKILRPEAVDFSLVSVAILAASILVKLWMSHFNRVLGKKLGSAAMAATAADSLSDVVATSAVLAGTLAGHFAHLSIDGWAGAVVAVFILKAGWGAAKDTINPLLGARPDPGGGAVASPGGGNARPHHPRLRPRAAAVLFPRRGTPGRRHPGGPRRHRPHRAGDPAEVRH